MDFEMKSTGCTLWIRIFASIFRSKFRFILKWTHFLATFIATVAWLGACFVLQVLDFWYGSQMLIATFSFRNMLFGGRVQKHLSCLRSNECHCPFRPNDIAHNSPLNFPALFALDPHPLQVSFAKHLKQKEHVKIFVPKNHPYFPHLFKFHVFGFAAFS